MDFRADPNEWDLYAQIQCLLRLIPRFLLFFVSLLTTNQVTNAPRIMPTTAKTIDAKLKVNSLIPDKNRELRVIVCII